MADAEGLLVVAGVPGTGKTILGSWLARVLGLRFTTLSWLVLEHGAWRGYDPERRSFIVDMDRLCAYMPRVGAVVETHWVQGVVGCGVKPSAIVLLRCNPLILLRRLMLRGWPPRKVAENVEAEMLGVVAAEALQAAESTGAMLVEVDTSHDPDPAGVAAHIARLLDRGVEGRGCCIDWLELLGDEGMEELLSKLSQLRAET